MSGDDVRCDMWGEGGAGKTSVFVLSNRNLCVNRFDSCKKLEHFYFEELRHQVNVSLQDIY